MAYDNLVSLTPHIHLILGPTNIGVITHHTKIYIIDSGGNDRDGEHILSCLQEHFPDKKLFAIINTHSNADHSGGNAWLKEKTDCEIWATRGERAFIENPILEPALFWGAFPFTEIRKFYFEGKQSLVTRLLDSEENIELTKQLTLQCIPLPGHFINMIGIQVIDHNHDSICTFLGDGIFGLQMLDKFPIPYTFDVIQFKNTLDFISTIDSDYYVPSHGAMVVSRAEIGRLVQVNKKIIGKVENVLLQILEKPLSLEKILDKVAEKYNFNYSYSQYVLISSTIKSFLSSLYTRKLIHWFFKNNTMFLEIIT